MLLVRNSLRWWVTLSLLGGLAAGPGFAKDREDAQKKSSNKTLRQEFRELANFEDDEEEDASVEKRYGTKVETRLVGEYATFSGIQAVTIEGVGLVVGLNGTGGNPAPSGFRTALMEDLKRRGIKNPNEILKSPDTALVYLRATLPPVLEKGETIDVQVLIPESAEATSLQGGWLMEAYLSEQAFVPGKGNLQGHHFARAKGPILTAAVGSNKSKNPALLTRGVVLGGATVMRERELAIYLRNDFRSIRQAMRVADAISKRFHDYDKHGSQQPMAVAKNDQKITLLIHPRYKNNFPRYLQVIRHLAFNEKPAGQRLRLQRLKDEIRNPETSEQAALQLEGIGKAGLPVLKAGLESPMLECRFHAACALAYLGTADGISVLVDAARSEPAFRVYALAALSVIDDAEANAGLRDLMHESSMETRYGAFRSLWVLDQNDPFIRGEKMEILEGKSAYMLHVIDTPGEPLVHVTTRSRPEVVLFGAKQPLTAPLYVTAGKHIMVTAQPGAQVASVRRFAPNEPDQSREVPLDVASLVHAVGELNGTYPDVVQMLMEAAEQRNLPGRFAHDALPEAGRMYERPPMPGIELPKSKRKTRVGRDNLTPNLFPLAPEKEEKADDEQIEAEKPPVMLNVPPESEQSTEQKSAKKPVRVEEPKPEFTKGESDEVQTPTRTSFIRLPSALKPRVRKFTPKETATEEPPVITTKPAAKSKLQPAERAADSDDLSTGQSEPN